MRVLLQPMSALFSLKCSVAIFFDEDSIGIGKDHGSRNYFNPCEFQFDSYLTGTLLLASLGIGSHGQHTEFNLGDFSAVANCTDGDNARPAAIREECRHISAHKCAGDLFATINDQHAAVSRLFHEFFEQ